ncbi:MAG TPA: VanZ family protein, partial [Phycisphaerales bacterium]|nr:VanZ family protein [Phycisphaerales bacterium]
MSHVDPARARQRRIARPWRVLFIVYAAAMTTGTHWPRLDLSVGEIRAPDKILHMLAFGGLAFLLSRTRWVRSRWMLLFIMLVWAMLDEITQAIPILGRTFSWLDVSAGAMGIALVTLWLWVLGPVGGELNRRRQQFAEYVLDEMALRPVVWFLTGAAGLLMAGATGTAAGLILWWRHPDGIYTAAVAGAIAGSIAGAHGMIDALWRRERMKIEPTKPCFACGYALGNASVKESGIGRCPSCGESFHLLQWSMRANLSSASARSLSFRAVAVAII